MGGPFAEHPVRLAAAAGAANENLEHRARQQGRLRPRLRLPPDGVLSGGGRLGIRHQCFSPPPGAYSACHSSRVAETAGARMTVGRAISPECPTDERREWQKGAAALAISSRRPTGWLGSRMIRSMYASGSSPVTAASCRTCSLAQLAAPWGRSAFGGRFDTTAPLGTGCYTRLRESAGGDPLRGGRKRGNSRREQEPVRCDGKSRG